jgi:Tfp pilus assembly protein PilN
MKIPFLHQDTAGLYITEGELVWVALRCTRRRWRILQTEIEAIEDGDLRAALDRLKDRVSYQNVPLVTNLDAYHVRHFVLQGPALDDPETLQIWLQNEAVRRLPPGTDPERFVFRFRLLEQTEDLTRGLLVVASTKAVQERAKLLLDVGLNLTGLGSIHAAIDQVLALQHGFSDEATLILLHHRKDVVLFTYHNSILQTINQLESCADSREAILQGIKTHLSLPDPNVQTQEKPNRLYIISPDAESLARMARDVKLINGPIQEVRVISSISQPLSPAQVPAAAFAFKAFFSGMDTINFLDSEQAYTQRQIVEKHEAMQAVLSLGGLLMVMLLVVTLISGYLDYEQAKTDEQLSLYAEQVAEIDQARSNLELLETSVRQAEHLVLERTGVAQILEAIGRATPEEVWLDALDFETTDVHEVTLNGFSYYESGLNTFLTRLEQWPSARQVQLVVSETQQAGILFRKTNLRTDRSISQFEIRLVFDE